MIHNTFLPEVGVGGSPLLGSERTARPLTRLGHIAVTAGSRERVATYAQRIKNKTGKTRKAAAARPAAKARPAAAPKPAPAAAPKPQAPAAKPAALGELQQLKNELQRINQEISRLARASRPDAARQMNLPEKQELLRQKAVLDSKIRAGSRT